MNKVVKFFQMFKFVIEYRQFFSLAMIVSLLLTAGCAAIQGAYVQPSLLQSADTANKVSVLMNATKDLATALQDGTITLLQKPGHGYVISWATEQGQAFVFVLKNCVMPKGLLAGANRIQGILDQFGRDGWQPVSSAELAAIMAKLMSLPFPTLMLFPIGSLPDLNKFLNPQVVD